MSLLPFHPRPQPSADLQQLIRFLLDDLQLLALNEPQRLYARGIAISAITPASLRTIALHEPETLRQFAIEIANLAQPLRVHLAAQRHDRSTLYI